MGRRHPGSGNGNLGDEIRSIFDNFKKQAGNGSSGSGPGSPRELTWLFPFLLGGLIVVAGFKSFYVVETDEVGVLTRFGRYVETTEPGAHLKIPFVDTVYKVQSKRRQQQEFGILRDRRGDPTGATNSEESLMLTGDLNMADVKWTVQYEISDPWLYLFKVKDVVKTIREVSMSMVRRVVGDRRVGDTLTTGRAQIADEVKTLMQQILDAYDIGIRVTTIELQAVDPPAKVRPAFNEVNAAKQEQEQAINDAERQYNKIIPEARGKAEQQIADASAYAIGVVNRAKGDADRFSAVLKEYKKAPEITRTRMYLETMEEVLGRLPNGFTVVDPQVKGLIPMYGPLMDKKESTP